MNRRSLFLLCSLVITVHVLSSAYRIPKVEASETIYIRADGLIEGTDKIQSADNVTYVFIGNINGSIVVERSSVTIDGNGFALDGAGLTMASGFNIAGAGNVTIRNVNVRGFSSAGILISQSSLNTISGNNITGNYYGIRLDSSGNNTVTGNRVVANSWFGVYLYSSNYNNVCENTLEENSWHAVGVDSSSDNKIAGNDIERNWRRGINLQSSSRNLILENTVRRSGWNGIRLTSSSHNSVSGNDLKYNVDGIVLISSSNHNTVSRNNVTGDTMTGIYDGIWLDSSMSNTITGNKVGNYTSGITTWLCSNNTVIENHIENNIQGVLVHLSSTSILRNTIVGNNVGLLFENSSGSLVYHNNVISNDLQTNVTSGLSNIWDSGYPSGGNYWSDYGGADQYSGPYQNTTGSDFIGDIPYTINSIDADSYPFMIPCEIEPPTISILHPENATSMPATDIALDFTTNEAVTWIGYSLDGQTNTTIAGNTTLPTLPDGDHYLTVYAKDLFGNTGASGTVFFHVNALPPSIQIISPGNQTYSATSIPLTFTLDETTSWAGYSLDGQANMTIAENITLAGLSEGLHYILVYANDTVGNMGFSTTTYFSVDTTPPNLAVVLPANISYYTSSIALRFRTNEALVWIGYSLDDHSNVTVGGNTTIDVEYGFHYVTVYANDSSGNMGSSAAICFTVTIPGDVDCNFKVDIFDVVKISSRYGKERGDPLYDSSVDIDDSGVIDILDIVICTSHYGQKWP